VKATKAVAPWNDWGSLTFSWKKGGEGRSKKAKGGGGGGGGGGPALRKLFGRGENSSARSPWMCPGKGKVGLGSKGEKLVGKRLCRSDCARKRALAGGGTVRQTKEAIPWGGEKGEGKKAAVLCSLKRFGVLLGDCRRKMTGSSGGGKAKRSREVQSWEHD